MSEAKIVIDGREISSFQTPYIIAELSANHNGKLETALKIIDEAAEAGRRGKVADLPARYHHPGLRC